MEPMTEKDTNKLLSFHNGFLRKILGIFWPTKVTHKTGTKWQTKLAQSGKIGGYENNAEKISMALDWSRLKKTNKWRNKSGSQMDPQKKKGEILSKTIWRQTAKTELKKIKLTL